MTDAQPAPPQRVILQPAPPESIVGAVSGVLSDLKSAPILLLIVILNGFFAGAASYYLVRQEDHRDAERTALYQLLDKCANQTVSIDALRLLRDKGLLGGNDK